MNFLLILTLNFLCASVRCESQGYVAITFNGLPTQPTGTAAIVQQYYESGMSFVPLLGSSGFVRRGGGVALYPEDGTAYLQALLGNTVMFSFINDAVFNLESVELAEYSTVVPDARTVHFVGYRHDGTVVSTDVTTDGIIDGTGPLADFQTFTFDQGFTDLDRVEIPTYGWSLDNLVVSINVPEPTPSALLFLGGILFRATRKQRLIA